MAKRKILIPLDGSEFGRTIVPYVSKFFSPDMVEIVLFRAAAHPQGMTGRPSRPASAEVPVPMYESSRDVEYMNHPVYASQEMESELAEISDELKAEGEPLRAAGFEVIVAVRFGDAQSEIVKYVMDEDIAMVAMTTHGRSGVSRVMAGSVAGHVMRHALVPVIMLRPFAPVDSKDGDGGR
ncbi:MAG: universal stress protein [Chloroflexi bacterium]|nr:universal stress protein [Chloroflexota bacterium]